MASPGYLWIKDDTGHVLQSDSHVQGREGSAEIFQFEHRIYIPVDRDTGILTGTRKHEPYCVIKHFCPLSPLLYKACCSGKTLKEVRLSWYRIQESGKEEEYFRHTLSNTRVVSVKPFVPHIKDRNNESLGHLEAIEFRYEKIQWLYLEGNIITEDQWLER